MARQNLAGLQCMQTRVLVVVLFESFGCMLGHTSFVRKPLHGVNGFLQVLYII